MSSAVQIRPGNEADIPQIQDVEVAAGQLFLTVDMPDIAADPPPSQRLLRSAIAQSSLLVAVIEDAVVGYGVSSQVDGHLHLEQVSIRPEVSRQGIGAMIFDALEKQGASLGLTECTLFTFEDVAWNAPYYERLGYRRVPQAEVGGGLARIFALERHADGDGRNRIAMRKALR
jgi:ribosomal protein S18 acetylase RimI-like enzyme